MALALAFGLTLGLGGAAPSPTAEFDSPYAFRLLADGAIIEVSGSFSWALPQNFQAVLASSPQVRIVQFESPGGHVKPALEIAEVIRQRGLDTYVGRFCASACTVAFLGGRRRWVSAEARLGFHQAHAPGVEPELANDYLRRAYEHFAVPAPFIERVLAMPPTGLWFPTRQDLLAVGFTTGAPPASLGVADDGSFRDLRDVMASTRAASDAAVLQFATALTAVFGRLQEVNPESCWAFAHDLPVDLKAVVPAAEREGLVAAERRVAAEAAAAAHPAGLDAEQRKAAVADITDSMRARGQASALANLRLPADHATYCGALRALLAAAQAVPEDRRVRALRLLLSGG